MQQRQSFTAGSQFQAGIQGKTDQLLLPSGLQLLQSHLANFQQIIPDPGQLEIMVTIRQTGKFMEENAVLLSHSGHVLPDFIRGKRKNRGTQAHQGIQDHP